MKSSTRIPTIVVTGTIIVRKLVSSMTAFCVLSFICCLLSNAQQGPVRSELVFHSSDPQLNESFDWAKQQALAYVRPASSPIGEWYEAALPGRDAFCMRDVSHQTTGAAALDLFTANRNMLGRFAGAVSDQRNWAGYWEIDSNGNPSSADYVSDSDFWYNLPANFDVVDAIVRMWRWTGDDSYRDDKDFQRFFNKSLTDYIDQWQLTPSVILKRPRIANQQRTEGRFVNSRGIPSYVEGPRDFIFGTDLLAAEYRAIHSYSEIASAESDRRLAARLQPTAERIQHILETVAWSSKSQHFNGVVRRDLSGFGTGDTMALYFDAVKVPSHIQGSLAYISAPSYWKKVNIEEESYVPLVLFRYGRPDAAYRILLDLSSPEKPRREYPEVSFAVIATIVSGAMGIEPSGAAQDFEVKTLPQLRHGTEILSVKSLHIRGNVVDVIHNGDRSTRFENREGPAIRWRAGFKGVDKVLYTDGKPQPAVHGALADGSRISWITVTVPPGTSVTISRGKARRSHE